MLYPLWFEVVISLLLLTELVIFIVIMEEEAVVGEFWGVISCWGCLGTDCRREMRDELEGRVAFE